VPEFRRATAADIPALHALIERAYRGDSAKRGWTHEADLLGGQRTDRQALAAMITAPDQRILIAVEDGALIGCVHVTDKRDGLAYLGLLTVDPDRQAGGLGRALLAAAEALAVDDFGAYAMEMTVIARRSELVAWYERRGYSPTGEMRPFPYDDRRFGSPVVRDLDFVVLARTVRDRSGSP
jgi:GNAT superfamily N-acetyltransferase